METDKLTLTCKVDPIWNYAYYHRGLSFVREVLIQNYSEESYEQLTLRIESDGELLSPYALELQSINAKEERRLRDVKVTMNGDYLASLTEKAFCNVNISLYNGAELLASQQEKIAVLALDQCPGLDHMPELLSLYVMPNHPRVTEILHSACGFLKLWTGDPSLNAYQTGDHNRVRYMAAAVYAALQRYNITYAEPPASFEQAGQRVRFADAILDQRLGTCMDLSLLYASCLEAMGLNPLLIHMRGHILPGVWLEDNSFQEYITEDPGMITKRMSRGIHEIVIMESTDLCAGRNIDFEQAVADAAQEVAKTDGYFAAMDVKRARLKNYTPLPIRMKTESGFVIRHEARQEEEITSTPVALGETYDFSDLEENEEVTKQTQWERKLLDLSLRNMLINMRITKGIVPLLADNVGTLEDALFDGEQFQIMPRPADMELKDEDVTNPEQLADLGSFKEYIVSEAKRKKLHGAWKEKDLAATLTKIYRSAKSSLEENGASTLYLALGLLRWTEDRKDGAFRYAPLILVPVELIRKAANKGYILQMRDEEAQINITMLEFLKQTYDLSVPGLVPAPVDEHGLDIPKVFALVRRAVMDMKGWDVIEAGFLGNYSFSQFALWKDIHSNPAFLEKNKIVHGLMEGVVDWDCTIPPEVDTAEAYLPVTVDASQLRAINMAAHDVSFVLHGPPGTGKSQTITAMISNALTQGKTVLFVAEKMAALEVVQKRLGALDISDFCLELHSNKATKKSVLDQLKRGLEIEKVADEPDYEVKIQDIRKMREKLDAYVKALHAQRPFGRSLRQLIDLYETVPELGKDIRFTKEYAGSLTEMNLEDQIHSLEVLVAAGRVIGHPKGHPLSCVRQTEYSQSLKFDMVSVVEAYKETLMTLEDDAQKLWNLSGGISTSATTGTIVRAGAAQTMPATKTEWEQFLGFAECLKANADIPAFLRETDSLEKEFYQCLNFMELKDAFMAKRKQFREQWSNVFLHEDMRTYQERYEQANKKLFGKAKAVESLTKEIQNYASFPLKSEEIPKYLTEISYFQKETTSFEQKERELPGIWMELLAKYPSLEEMKAYKEQVKTQLQAMKPYEGVIGKLKENGSLEACIAQAKTMLASLYQSEEAGVAVDKMLLLDEKAWNAQVDSQVAAEKAAAAQEEAESEAATGTAAQTELTDSEEIPMAATAAMPIKSYIARRIALCDSFVANASHIKDWVIYNQFVKECRGMGLDSVCDAYEAGLPHDEVLDVYRRCIYRMIIKYVVEQEPVLNGFTGAGFNERIAQFKKLDLDFMELTKEEMYYKLTNQLPEANESVQISHELSQLRKAISSNARGQSIRSLFDQIRTILPRLCPCMLMSPISVAQYLPAENDQFDIVIFDEASQLPTCKAVGVLARGKNAVIVGDPNQMPPTSFFAGNTVDEDNLDIEDLDSVLDDCLALGMPQSHLHWHYRSRHESLIAFSNQEFYENSMLTFPSVNDREKRVTMVKLEGSFDRGKGRVNEAEAKAIVEEIKRRAQDTVLSQQSLGVVTFNIPQQTLIEDLLQSAYQKDAQFDQWANASEEPLFVKNLENVQGDERDVILFSVAFGPDKNGKVSLNFGPLNKDGGWKRLNVAVTRARMEMMVFTTMTADMIDLRRTRARGVEALRDFLEYAQKARLFGDLGSAKRGKNQGITDQICDTLTKAGYEYQCQVGHSKFRVDIAVVDPDNAGEYLLGIVLDGESYRQSSHTKDREVGQLNVLKGLGWKLHRVWTMDWWDNREKELEQLMSVLTQARNRGEQA